MMYLPPAVYAGDDGFHICEDCAVWHTAGRREMRRRGW